MGSIISINTKPKARKRERKEDIIVIIIRRIIIVNAFATLVPCKKRCENERKNLAGIMMDLGVKRELKNKGRETEGER